MPFDISIEPFRGDLEALQKMAISSWQDEYGISSFPNLYRPAFVRFLMGCVPDKRLFLAAYKGDEIVSFFANLPRRFRFQGEVYKAVLSCLIVTRKEMFRHGLALGVVKEALELNKELDYDFALLYLETGHRSNFMIKKLEEAGHPVEWVKRMHVLGRVLDLDRVSTSEGLKAWERAAIKVLGGHRLPKSGSSLKLRYYRPEDLDVCLELLNQYQERVRLARVWDRDELAWELDFPDVSRTLVYEKKGKVEGLISFLYHHHLGKTQERWAWINHLAYPNLTPRERLAFINAFLLHLKEAGCVGALEWTKKYYPTKPLYRAHFFPYFRSLNMYSWTFNPDISLRNIPDVYEVQI